MPAGIAVTARYLLHDKLFRAMLEELMTGRLRIGMFQMFRNVNEVVVNLGRSTHRQVTDIDVELIKIIKLVGSECERYYV